ncbi:MAG: aldo/keto reductase [Fimbriimonadaceae bacterium]|nr:aldo/keto reductase [Fimbriimonadaceae bacterium]
MQRRLLARTGWEVAPLGFGCMRFHDEETAIAAVHAALDAGVNYFDVAPLYGGGSAEVRLGKALVGRRAEAIVTAKSSPGNGGDGLCEANPVTGFGIRTADQARAQIERSMRLLGVDHLDMYQLWACHSPLIFEEALRPGGFLAGVLKAHAEGLCDQIGLTTHGSAADIIRFLRESPYEFDLVTLPFHPQNTSRAPAVAYCLERGIGVVAMNPLAGGRFAQPSSLLQRLAGEAGCATFVEAALRAVAFWPGITCALNGITFADHVAQGVAAMGEGPLPATAVTRLTAALDEVYQNVRHFCTGCGYCGECPVGLQIPEILASYSHLLVPSLCDEAASELRALLAAGVGGLDPSVCEACQRCEEQCPNKLPIASLMREAVALWPAAD